MVGLTGSAEGGPSFPPFSRASAGVIAAGAPAGVIAAGREDGKLAGWSERVCMVQERPVRSRSAAASVNGVDQAMTSCGGLWLDGREAVARICRVRESG